MAKPLGYIGQGAVYLLLALGIGYFSDRPAYTHFPPDMALIKLSFAHGGQKEDCRRRTAEELANLPPNMRRPMVCSRERLPVAVELLIDGAPLYQAVLPPTGLAGDGPSRAYQRFAVPPGRHELSARLRDTDRAEGFDFERTAVVELAPAQSLAIDFRAEMGGFVFR
jgi:hypothetical protein